MCGEWRRRRRGRDTGVPCPTVGCIYCKPQDFASSFAKRRLGPAQSRLPGQGERLRLLRAAHAVCDVLALPQGPKHGSGLTAPFFALAYAPRSAASTRLSGRGLAASSASSSRFLSAPQQVGGTPVLSRTVLPTRTRQ